MIASKETVLAQALALNEVDRQEIIDRLSETLDAAPELSAAWEAEIDRRLDAVDAGQMTFVPWEQVRRQLVEGVDAPHD